MLEVFKMNEIVHLELIVDLKKETLLFKAFILCSLFTGLVGILARCGRCGSGVRVPCGQASF